MIRHYCDVCKTEIKERNYVDERYKPKLNMVRCEIVVNIGNTWNKGDICKKCLIEVVVKGKE